MTRRIQGAHFAWLLIFAAGVITAGAQRAPAPGGNTSAAPAKPGSTQSNAAAPVRRPPMEPYTGMWTGSAQGRVFVTLRLELKGESITGSLQHPRRIDVSDDGNVKNCSDDFSKSVVQKAQLTGDGLLITVVEDDETHDSEQFAMQMTGENTAQLKMLAMSMPPGMAKPKPWKITKQGSPAPR